MAGVETAVSLHEMRPTNADLFFSISSSQKPESPGDGWG
jgi:hypothetical protein